MLLHRGPGVIRQQRLDVAGHVQRRDLAVTLGYGAGCYGAGLR
jgi:hypothetical protein